MLAAPYSLVESVESTVCFSQSDVYFSVNLDVWCDGTPQVSEWVNCFQLSSIDGDIGRVVLF